MDHGEGATQSNPTSAIERGERTQPFGERDFDELASFLRGTFKARRVERTEDPDSGEIELRLLGREEALKHTLIFERACLDRSELADLRGYLVAG